MQKPHSCGHSFMQTLFAIIVNAYTKQKVIKIIKDGDCVEKPYSAISNIEHLKINIFEYNKCIIKNLSRKIHFKCNITSQ